MNGAKFGGGGRGTAAAGQQWKVGLVNHAGKYLTAETFGFKINAASSTFRKKQMWTIEQEPGEDDTVYVRSHVNRYLAGDAKVNHRLRHSGCSKGWPGGTAPVIDLPPALPL